MTGRRGAPSGTGRSGRRSRGRGGAVVDGGIDHRLRWEGDDRLVVGPTSFDLTVDPARWAASSSADRFVLLKTRRMVEAFVRNVPDRVERVVDLGIFKGGSIALCCELFHPERIVGVDLEPARVQALDEFVDRRSLGRSVELHFGTDQGDREALTRIVEDGSGGRPLDLVVDDGSHLYAPTRASLEVLLPRLRPGGVYVIEDWGWAHWEGTRWQGPDSQYASEATPLSKLVLELVLVTASRPGLISEITIRSSQVFLTRGDEDVPPDGFDVTRCYLTAGRDLLR